MKWHPEQNHCVRSFHKDIKERYRTISCHFTPHDGIAGRAQTEAREGEREGKRESEREGKRERAREVSEREGKKEQEGKKRE